MTFLSWSTSWLLDIPSYANDMPSAFLGLNGFFSLLLGFRAICSANLPRWHVSGTMPLYVQLRETGVSLHETTKDRRLVKADKRNYCYRSLNWFSWIAGSFNHALWCCSKIALHSTRIWMKDQIVQLKISAQSMWTICLSVEVDDRTCTMVGNDHQTAVGLYQSFRKKYCPPDSMFQFQLGASCILFYVHLVKIWLLERF